MTSNSTTILRLADCSDARLREIIREELQDIQPRRLGGEWSDAASFREDLALDSLDLVEMVARLEQATALHVPDADIPQLVSIDATVRYLRRREAETPQE